MRKARGDWSDLKHDLADLRRELEAERVIRYGLQTELHYITVLAEERLRIIGQFQSALSFKIKRKLIPPGSPHFRLLSLVGRGLGVLRRKGPVEVYRSARRWQNRRRLSTRLHCGLEALPSELAIGAGSHLLVTGWCFRPDARVKEVSLLLGQKEFELLESGLPRPDVHEEMKSRGLLVDSSFMSGFRIFIPFDASSETGILPISLRVKFSDRPEEVAALGKITVKAQADCHPIALEQPRGEGPLVAICMTTYKPSIELFERQIQSVIDQTHRNWICVITDDHSPEDSYRQIQAIVAKDKRFHLQRNEKNLGYYRNFERAICSVPVEADFIALSDQDDEWYPHKLASLLTALEGDAILAYSDMRVVTEDGRVLANSFWNERQNNYRSLEAMFVANTVTGAACLFKRKLLDVLLPFPQKAPTSFHDHWLACSAISVGRIEFVSEPLYSYVQHGANVLGYSDWPPFESDRFEARYRDWLTLSREQRMANMSLSLDLARGRNLVLWLRQKALTLQTRLEPLGYSTDKLEELLNLTQGAGSFVQLVRQLKPLSSATCKIDRWMYLGLLWEESFIEIPSADEDGSDEDEQSEGSAKSVRRAVTPPSRDYERALNLEADCQSIIAPLRLEISRKAPKRVNLLLSEINFKYFYGGYIAVFQLAKHLSKAGLEVRMVTTSPCELDLPTWELEIAKYQGLAGFFDFVEVECRYNRLEPLVVSPEDRFISTSWWTSHVAHAAVQDLGIERFVYLTQDYEPIFYERNHMYALAEESYSFPHYALFSTKFLLDFARSKRIGMFQAGREPAEGDFTYFENAIMATAPSIKDMSSRSKKKLLFYSRPEAHASRNLFPLAHAALKEAIKEGHFDVKEWEFHGIGTVTPSGAVPLARGARLKILPKLNLDEYHEVLKDYDLGMSLMLSPHPSLVPLDMSAAGMPTVTNTYETKTAERLTSISRNLVPCSPTLEGIKAGLVEGLGRVPDFESRIAGSHLNWARNWDEAFNERVVCTLSRWLDAPSGKGADKDPRG